MTATARRFSFVRWPRSKRGRAGVILVGVVLLPVLLLSLPPVRAGLLSFALERSTSELPGHLEVADIAWFPAGRIELRDIVWSVEGDTLFSADHLAVQLDLGELVHQDVLVRELILDGLRADVPAIQEALAAMSDTAATTAVGSEPKATPAFPRPGSLPGIPSIAVERLLIGAKRVDLSAEQSLSGLRLVASAELRREMPAEISLDTLVCSTSPASWRIDAGELGWRPSENRISAHLAGLLAPGQPFVLELIDTAADRFDWSLALEESQTDLAGDGHLEVGLAEGAALGFGLNASGQVGTFELKFGAIDLAAPEGPAGPIDVDLRAVARELDLITRARIVRATDVVISLSAIDVAIDSTATLVSREAGPLTGQVTVRPDGRLSVESLSVRGALGQFDLRAEKGIDRITADLDASWPTPPPFLLRLARCDSLAWPASPAPGLHLDLRATSTDGQPVPDRGTLRASLILPGPAHLVPLLPEDPPENLPWDELGTLIAELEAELEPGTDGPRIRGTVDLSQTEWVETGRLAARWIDRTAHIDTLDLRLPVLGLPRLMADAHFGDDGFEARLGAPDGVTLQEWVLDVIEVEAASSYPVAEAKEVRFSAAAGGPRVAIAVQGEMSAGPPLSVSIDTLGARLLEENLASAQPFLISQGADAGSWRVQGLELTGSLGRLAAEGQAAADGMDLRADWNLRFPITLLRELAPQAALPRDDDLVFLISGDGSLAGTPTEPGIAASIRASIEGDERLADLDLGADLTLAAGTVTTDPGSATVLSGSLFLDRADGRLLSGEIGIPLLISEEPFAMRPSPTDSFRIGLTILPIELGDFRALLPPELEAEGVCEGALQLRGVGNVADLAGRFEAPKLRFGLDDGSWLSLGGDFRVAGTSQHPEVTGSLALEGGVIVIPDVPPVLLPSEGEAWLLDAPLAGEETAAVESPSTEEAPAPELTLDVSLHCPGNFWLRGRGLAIELAGDLEVTQDGPLPEVVGELKAMRGSLKFMGRHFEVERGTVSFYGDLEDDPLLDLELMAVVEGVTYRIGVQGRALAPELKLSSDPEMAEGDIIASLLFGKPLDELDGGQENLLKQRTAQILAALGASELSDRLSGSLGADLVSYNQAADEDDTASLMVGKYLSPRVLLKYEQQLGGRKGFFVRLDYTLNRMFRLETSVGQGTESGVELKWGTDY